MDRISLMEKWAWMGSNLATTELSKQTRRVRSVIKILFTYKLRLSKTIPLSLGYKFIVDTGMITIGFARH